MLKLSLAQCLKATKDGSFSTSNLNLDAPLSYDDMIFLAEYLRVTPLQKLDLVLAITPENCHALSVLSDIVSSETQLKQFSFEASIAEFEFYFRNGPQIGILNFIDNYRLRKLTDRVNDALVEMVENKPVLEKLKIDFEQIETPLSKSQSKQFARHIQRSPLTSLDLGVKVEHGAKLPIFPPKKANTTLTHLSLYGCTEARDVLNDLKRAYALKSLIINGMKLEESDLLRLKSILESNASVHQFTLSKTNIGQIDSPHLFDPLYLCPEITILDLSDNNLSRLNIDILCTYLSSDQCKVLELDLSNNTYMAEEARSLATALAANKSIQKLTIDGNFIEDAGLQSIINLLKTNRHITEISMNGNCRYNPSDDTIKALCALLTEPDCQLTDLSFVQKLSFNQMDTLRKAILSNNSLISVNLNYKMLGILGQFCKLSIDQHLSGDDIEMSDWSIFTDTATDTEDSFNAEGSESENSHVKSGSVFFLPEKKDSFKDGSESLEISSLNALNS